MTNNNEEYHLAIGRYRQRLRWYMTNNNEEYHSCEHLDYNAMYRTLLRGALVLAEHDEMELSEEMWGTAVGFREILDHD